MFILMAVSGSLLVYNMMPDLEKLNLSQKFSDQLGVGREPPALFKIFRLPILLLTDFASSLKMTEAREKYRNKLAQVGVQDVVSVDQLIALRITILIVAVIYGILLVALLPAFFSVLLVVGAWFYIDFWLDDKIRQRRAKTKTELPFFLDMLTLSVEAGLEFTAAIARIVSKMEPSPLREELVVFLRQMQLGMSRRDALRAMAERLEITQITSMVTALIQAADMGASIGAALRTQSEIMNAERFQEAEKKGAEASQKMLFPMVIFIAPAIMLVVLGPLVIQFVYGGGAG